MDVDAGTFIFNSASLTANEKASYMPTKTYSLRQTYASTDSLAAGSTYEDYFSLTIRADCGNGVLTVTSELPDQVYVDSTTGTPFRPLYGYTRDSAECPLTAVLNIYDESSNQYVVYDSAAGNA